MYTDKSRTSTKPVMYEIITEKEALALTISKNVSVSVIALIPNLSKEKHAQLMVIDEYKQFDQARKSKFPGGKMEMVDKTVIDALKREIREETGYLIEELEFCFAAEFSSTIPGERHYKVFFVVRKFLYGGDPYKKDPGVLSWKDVKGIENTVIKNHHCCLKNGAKILMELRVEFAQDLMNYKPLERLEGQRNK